MSTISDILRSALTVGPKVFELRILDRFRVFFGTSDDQFGLKEGVGCRQAMYVYGTAEDR